MNDTVLFVLRDGLKVAVHSPTPDDVARIRELQEDGAPLEIVAFFFCALCKRDVESLIRAGAAKVISIDSSYGAPSQTQQILGDKKSEPYAWFVCHGGIDGLADKLLEVVG